jgi:hypothetical protein
MFKPLGGKRIKGESICLSKNLIYLKEIQWNCSPICKGECVEAGFKKWMSTCF